ncbi:MAG: MCP four helix bundle domain-containing protein [Burkholderiales bacterium]|nr:MCP four helix bundle domain-containing protein [Burkholderiales bacterium]
MSIFTLMRTFSIRFRMVSAIGVVLGLLLMLGGVGMGGMYRMQALSQDFMAHAFADESQVVRLQIALGQLRLAEREMVIQHAAPDAVRQAQTQWQAHLKDAQARIQALAATRDARVADTARAIQQRVDAYAQALAPAVTELSGGAVTSAAAANALVVKAHQEFTVLEQQLLALEDLVQKEATVAVQEQDSTATTAKWLFVLAVLLTIVVVAPLTWLNMQSICKPLEQARGIAQAIATDDLSMDIRVEGKDEVSDLLRALDSMRNSLATTVGHMRDASENIANASQEIASGNQDLSTRTERAAGNVQSMVSSISELLATVQQTASSAQTANQLASAASGQATRGGAAVAHVVTSMHEISGASHKIGDIIGLINSIAFQTNILALNAAVEAARAGEQGRGFAVVASEVRSLAQRSAQAANDVKALIQASVSAVDGGVRLAEEAGAAMQEMVGGAQRVGGIIGEISSASAEQSHGIEGVNATVTEIDQMTQQNAALVEQSAAAAESLREQADRLAQLVRRFQLRHGEAQLARPMRLALAGR